MPGLEGDSQELQQWQRLMQCCLLGRTEEVMAPTGLPTEMESAFTRRPGGNPPPEGRGLRPGSIRLRRFRRDIHQRWAVPLSDRRCEWLDPQSPRRRM